MRRTRPILTLVASLGGACGGRPSQVAPVSLVPCAVPGVGSADSAWHQVRASGFTFCVPASWQASGRAHDSSDAQGWNGDEGSLTWGLGRPPARMTAPRVITGSVVVIGAPGANRLPLPANPTPLPMPQDPLRQRCSLPSNIPIVVDSVSLVITQVQCQDTWTTSAWSTAPGIYVQGEAHSVKGANVLLTVMQTIRFRSPPR
jgi:hypothetical protein